MDRPRDPFGVAVAAIRERMRSGRLVQGEQLRVSDLTRDLRLSATPVREALARVAGEGLIEDRRGAGYFAWRLDAVDLAELYALQAAYLRAALDAPGPRPQDGAPGGADPFEAAETLMLAVIQRGRSQALRRVHLRLADLLAPARRVEPRVLADLARETQDLAAALGAAEEDALMTWISAYQARRIQAAPALVAALRSAATAGPGI